jgi:magnesium-transporting ATPase (P-type)
MSEDEQEKPCLSDLGGLIQLFGGILVLGAQIVLFFFLQGFLAGIGTQPPDMQIFFNQLALIIVFAIASMVICGIVIIVAGFISLYRSGSLGGFLALLLGIIVLAVGFWLTYGLRLYPGPLQFLSGVLTVVGGILSIIPAWKPPQIPESRKQRDQREREKRK